MSTVGKCQAAGGTWVELGQNGSWSPYANSNLAKAVSNIQKGIWNAVSVVGLNGSLNVTQYTQFHGTNGLASLTDTGGIIQEYGYNASFPSGQLLGPSFPDINGAYAQYVTNQINLQPQDPDSLYNLNLANAVTFYTYNPLGMTLTQSTSVGANLALAGGGATVGPWVEGTVAIGLWSGLTAGGIGLTVATPCQ
jgi:hypothetical protein